MSISIQVDLYQFQTAGGEEVERRIVGYINAVKTAISAGVLSKTDSHVALT